MSASPIQNRDQALLPGKSCRFVICGMISPLTSSLASFAVQMMQRSGLTDIATGWSHKLDLAALSGRPLVARAHDYHEALAATATHIVYVYRDLRDATVAMHRGFGAPLDLATARHVMDRALQWEKCATLNCSYEQAKDDPLSLMRTVVEHGDGDMELVAQWADELRAAVANFERDPKQVPRGVFRQALGQEALERIEIAYGDWLEAKGYSPVSLPRYHGFGPRERSQRRRRELVERIDSIADQIRRGGEWQNATAEKWLRAQLTEFGPPKYQAMARRLVELASGRALSARCDGPSIGSIENGPICSSSGSSKTSKTPLPPVSPEAFSKNETVRRLGELVRGRTVGFLLHGGSVAELSQHASEVEQADVVWVSMNHFSLSEERFLRPAGRSLSAVFCCADGEVERRLAEIVSFCHRPARKYLVTRPDQYSTFEEQLGAFRSDIGLELLPPLWPYPNSLALFLRLLVQAGPRRIVLFGCDGYLGEDDKSVPSYYCPEEFQKGNRFSGVLQDTLLFNAHMPRILEAWRGRLAGCFPEIVNCSPGSLIRAFPLIDYRQLGEALCGQTILPETPLAPAPSPAPHAAGEDDPRAELVRCANAARAGDLELAREHALRAFLIAPGRLTPFALRVLQTDPVWVEKAFHLLGLSGADLPGSADRRQWLDFAREVRDASAAGQASRWDQWE